ncbi:protein involved in gliding motility GldF [Balneicella halophila]|uniref:Protein involved in gliding motility GldF n=1 Tax=Balneicella halophila TaxID=1537566 RepID=A0A7L4URS7_BALHA|nr:gliding motility-associated ABC transporter permease subunit GldF [Balneicella halophila]PVX52476.1 protein involved in gliding motility GldF [Balneicella halophila]
MFQIFRKEIALYFGSPMAYIVVAIFLLASALLLWVFPGYQNILDTEFANLDGLFTNAPWLFLWLIPALCMHLFSETYRTKKSLLLFTRPLSTWDIIMGKYWAGFVVILFALIPTFIFAISIYLLANPAGNVDLGAIGGSYIGLLFLASIYLSISLFTSSISNNQLIAFLLGVILCAFIYTGWTYLASIFTKQSLQNTLISLSIEEHYYSISRGVIDTRDLVYFILITVFFLMLTQIVITKKR